MCKAWASAPTSVAAGLFGLIVNWHLCYAHAMLGLLPPPPYRPHERIRQCRCSTSCTECSISVSWLGSWLEQGLHQSKCAWSGPIRFLCWLGFVGMSPTAMTRAPHHLLPNTSMFHACWTPRQLPRSDSYRPQERKSEISTFGSVATRDSDWSGSLADPCYECIVIKFSPLGQERVGTLVIHVGDTPGITH